MPIDHHEITLAAGGVVSVAFTGRAEGDLQVDSPPEELARRRRAVVDRPWVWLRQVHGNRVVDGNDPASIGASADAAVAVAPSAALAVHTADCGPIALVAPDEAVVGVVHAGWRGLVAGVVEEAVDAMRARGAGRIDAYVGPCISAAAYEFGGADLDEVAGRYGDAVRATTERGTLGLDLRTTMVRALEGRDVRVASVSTACTAGSPGELYSHRARQDTGRQAVVVWFDPGAGGGTS
jgi:YfiH family protein